MTQFYRPDLGQDIDSPFARDGANKLVRRSYWLDMDDRTLVMVMVNGIGRNLTNDEKRAHLARISHTIKCIGVANQRKSLCCNTFSLISGDPDADRV
jgi:hypothetical protein